MNEQNILPSRKDRAPRVNDEYAKMRRLATVVLDSNDAITILDFDGRINAWNRGAELMYGYSENEALRMTIWQLAPPDKTAEQKEFNRRIFAGEKVSSFETQRQTKDGGILDVWITVTKLVDDSGKVIGIASTERDITERKKEEANLRRLATVLLDSNDAITISDFDGRITAWNRGAERMYGYSEEEALSMSIWLITPPDKIAEKKAFINRLIAGEAVSSFETQRVTKDGRILDVWLTLTKVMDDAGKPIGIASTERDVTERKKEEANLRRLATVLRDSNDAITIQDFEGKILAWNHGAEMMYGYNEQEALQKNIWLLTPPNRVKEQKDFTHRLIAGEKITSLETQRVTKDGRILDVWLTLTKVMDDAGKPTGIASTERDITERKGTEETLRESESRFRQLAESLPQLVWTCQPEGPCDFLSKKWLDYTGIPEASQMGFGWLEQLHPDDRAPTVASWEAAVSSGMDFHAEFRIRRHDGEYRWFDTQALRLRNLAGQTVKWFGSNTDITERKRLEDKLHQYTMQLEQKSRDLEQIIYVTSHDLRSPLVNAQGFAKELTKSIMELMEAVNTGDISAEAMRKMAPILKNDIPESLEYIQSSIARMDMQLSALLKLSRLGRAALTMENLDMNKNHRRGRQIA
jgi:PAS domain S-box-containing protein